MKYSLAHTLTYIENTARVYNWLNGEYIEFNDKEHPFFKIIQQKIKNFDKFKYNGTFDDFKWLKEKKFIIESQNEVYEIIKNNVTNINSNKYLQLTLLPAQMACNFNCVYCYEDKNQKTRMNTTHKEILLKFLRNRRDLENLQIEWFGGEPLLNIDFIEDFSKVILDYSKINKIDYRSSMTTNGYYLTKNIFLKLHSLNIRAYQITIDGLEENHDKLRPLANGEGTFKTIIKNLNSISNLKDIDFNIIIRVNFNEDSKIDDFIQYIKSINFANDDRFSFIFRPIQTDWNDITNEVACKAQPTYLQRVYEEKAIENGLKKGDYLLFKDIGSTSCYASRENSLIVYPDMSIRKCSIALDDEVNIVGHIDNGGNLVKNSNWDLWTLNKHSIHNKQECMNCSFNPQCLSSSCPLKFIKQGEIICPDTVYNLKNISNSIINYLEE